MDKSIPLKRPSSEALSEDMPIFEDPQDMVNAVISALQQPQELTNVAQNFANDKNLATEVQAYAKIAGADWTFYVKSLLIEIGRNTENATTIDIDLGPAKVVSRQHAQIIYNLDLRCWQLKVLGRNGARIDGNKVPVGSNQANSLRSGAILDVGGTQMMFILPDSPPEIHPNMLTKILTKYKENLKKKPFTKSMTPNSNNSSSSSLNNLHHNSIKSFQMFDKSALSQATTAVSASSLQNNLDQDLLKEESKDIKPPYSYATMITQAILSNEDGVMSLSEIYNWISSHYAYYKYSKTGWQNSIRHNLSLNKAFEKTPRRPNEPGKGMKWQISESYKQEFLNKISNGAISKTRRGSSVSRQLHLHLAQHKQLPEGQRIYPENEQNDLQNHERSNSLPKLTQNYIPPNQIPANSMNFVPQQNNGFNQRSFYQPNMYQNFYQMPQGQPGQMNHHQNMQLQHQQNLQHPQHPPHSQLASSQHQIQHHEQDDIKAESKAHSQPLPTSNSKSELSYPTRNFQDVNTTTPKLPKVTNGTMFNLPPPQNNGNTPFNGDNNYNSFNTTANNTTNHSLAQNQTTQNTEIGLSFSSPKKYAPLEAFTPERGSKPASNGKLLPNGVNTNQSSPAFWNFVQFSTPNGQTPMRKNSDELAGQGSPTLSRKVLANSNSFNTKEESDKLESNSLKSRNESSVDTARKDDNIE